MVQATLETKSKAVQKHDWTKGKQFDSSLKMNTILRAFNLPDLLETHTKEQRDEITKYCVRYLFKLITLAQFKRLLKDMDLKTEEWRVNSKLSEMCRTKLWIRYAVTYPNRNSAKSFHIRNPHDKDLRDVIFSDTRLFNEIRDIKGQVFTWKKMCNILNQAVHVLVPFAKRRAKQKLTFLRNDSGNDIEDFCSELMIYAIEGIYQKFPRFESWNHLLNTCRTVINNMSINIINYHTSKGRACKYQNADGSFSSHKVSFDALTADKATSEANIYIGDSLHTTEDQDELELQESLNVIATTSLRRRALRLMVSSDKKFSKWLVAQKVTTVSDNNKYHERLLKTGMNSKYLNLICQYLEIPKKSFKKFLTSVLVGLGADMDSRSISI